jgi:hypothetical protein
VNSQPEPVGPPGILVFRGSTFAITDFHISFDASGEMTSSMRPQIAWEIWPLWLRVAIDHEAAAKAAREQLATAGGPDDDQRRALLIEEETRACMVTVSAAAFTVEAMALAAATHAGLSPGIGRRASAARRVAETLKQCFAVPPSQFAPWRESLVMIFSARNEAVHPDAGLRDPLPHPGVRAGVPRPAHVYRLENATASVDIVLWTAIEAAAEPRPRLGKAFRERVAGWTQSADDLRTHRKSISETEP